MPLILSPASRVRPPQLNAAAPSLTTLLGLWQAHPLYAGQMQWPNLAPRRSRALQNATLVSMAANSATSGWGATTRKGGRAELRFDGSSTYVDVGDISDYEFTNQTFTVSCWFRATGTGTQYLLAKRSDAGGGNVGGWFVRLNNTGALEGRLVGPTGVCSNRISNTTALLDGNWHHVAVIFTTDTVTASNNAVTLYLDGVINQGSAGGTEVYSASSPSQPLRFGVVSNLAVGTTLLGALDDVRLYTGALGSADIVALYTQAQCGQLPEARRVRPMARRASAGTTVTLTPARLQWQAPTVTLTTPARPGVAPRVLPTAPDRVPPFVNPAAVATKRLLGLWRAHPHYRLSQTWPNTAPQAPPLPSMATLANMAANRPDSGWGPTGRRGGSGELRFDGVDDYVSVGDYPVYNFADTTFTVSCWFRATGTGNQYLVAKRSAATNDGGWFVRVSSTGLVARLHGVGDYTVALSTPALDLLDGLWHHAAVVFTTDTVTLANNTITIYLDGVVNQGSLTTGSVPYAAPPLPLVFGQESVSGGNLTGALDDIRLYTGALRAPEIAQLVQSAQSGHAPEFRRVHLLVTATTVVGQPSTVSLQPARLWWQAQPVALFTPPVGSVPTTLRDLNTFDLGSTAFFYLQTTNPDTGAAWDADALPTYRIYEENSNTPVTTGTYALFDAGNTDGTYATAVSLDGTLGFEPGKVYVLRSSWTIIGASEADIEEFTITRVAVQITPARVQWQPQGITRDRLITLTPARLQWQARTLGTSARTVIIVPARSMWTPQGILGERRSPTPARMAWQAGTVGSKLDLSAPPLSLVWRAQAGGITVPFRTGQPLAALSDVFIAGDWLIQSSRLQLKLSLTYNPDGTWEHRLVDLGDLEMTVAPGGGLATVANMTFGVAEDGTGQSLLQRWKRFATIGGTADITLDFLATDGTQVRVFTGIIDTIRVRNGRSDVQCVDESIQRNLQLPQTLITSNLYVLAASAAQTQPVPLVYGYGSHLHAAPLLLTNTSSLGYTAAAHRVSMTSQIAFYNAETQLFMPGAVSALAVDNTATLFLSTPLQQKVLNTQSGTMAILSQQAVLFPQAAVDSNPATLARVYTSAIGANGDGQGVLAVYATPTSSQRGNNQAVITLKQHRRANISDPTVTGQFLVQTTNLATGETLRSAIFTTQNFRHALNPQTTVHTIPNLALGDQEAVTVVLLARNEGGPGGISNYYEVQDISIQTGFAPGGDNFPIYLVGDFNGRRDGSGRVTPTGATTLYTLPNHVIGSLLFDELGLSLSDSVQAANTTYLQRNYTFAGGLGYGWHVTRAPARQILHDAAVQAAAILAPDLQGRWGLRPFEANAFPALAFDASTILCEDGQDATGSDSTEVVLGNMEQVHCRVEVHYAWNVGAQKFDQVLYAAESGSNAPNRDDLRYRCQLSALRYGITEPLIVHAYWISETTAAVQLLEHLVHYFSFQRIQMTFTTSLRALTVRLGDVIDVAHPLLPEADNDGMFEVHGIRISPLAGRITLTVSKRAVVYLEYFTIKDQHDVLWYWYFDEAGQLVRDNHVPSIPPLTSVDVTGVTTAPHWLRVRDDSGSVVYLYPDTLGQLVIDTVPPAAGQGIDTGSGLTAIGLNAQRYRLGVDGTPTQILNIPDVL